MKPTLLVLAAGMGSRYGGLKQLDGVGPQDQTIMDYSVFDALRAGFGKIVFVIRKDFEQDFREKVLKKYEGHIPVEVVFQSLDNLPEGFSVPEGRVKPWGTNHAIMMGETKIAEPFAVINADDFYGAEAFKVLAQELSRDHDREGDYAMVAFHVGNTMTENGSVSRGVCSVDNGQLTGVVEHTALYFDPKHQVTFKDATDREQHLDPNTPVSMNLWGFTPDYFKKSKREFVKFLEARGSELKSEFYIPSCVDTLIHNSEATVKVLDTPSHWFGVTYPQDRQMVVDRLAQLHKSGEYPDKMF